MEDRKNNCGLLILFTFVFGVLLGLLVSPESGEKNRLKLKYKTNDLVDSLAKHTAKILINK